MKKRLALFLSLLLTGLFVQAQEAEVTMADEMRQNGKIYVVVAVMLTILAGVIIYLVRLDRKISQLEKNSKS